MLPADGRRYEAYISSPTRYGMALFSAWFALHMASDAEAADALYLLFRASAGIATIRDGFGLMPLACQQILQLPYSKTHKY